MTGAAENGGRRINPWRLAAWGSAAGVIALPLVAMQFTDEIRWGPEDFVFAIVLIGGLGLVFELALRRSGSLAYRAGAGVALAAAFLLIWINAAVGVIAGEDNPANLLIFGVVAVALAGALAARFRPLGMARAMVAAAVAQAAVGAVALVYRSFEAVGLTVVFVVLWLASAWLFQRAAQRS